MIDPAALQAIVDETAQELLVPGYMVLLRTPQGEFIAASGTTKLGENSLPTADTHFRIAEITKTMTSAVILLLAQEGKLSLDDPVSKYLPEVPDGDNISIAQLLEMRSGLYSFTDAPEISTSMDNDRPECGSRRSCWTSPSPAPDFAPARSTSTATPTTCCSA